MPTYTNNVPQANQQISTTQAPIQNNFDYIQKAVGQEHNFVANDTDPTHTYHLQASMPNRALSPSVPAGTNGVYFVNAGIPYFFDGTTNWQLNPFQTVLTGTYTATSSSSFNTIVSVPANVEGMIILVYPGKPAGQIGTFMTDGSKCYAFSSRMKLNASGDDFPIELNNNTSTLNLQGRYFSSSYAGPYTYKVFYRPA